MRILHVTPTYLPATRYGGPIYSVHNLCSGLVDIGHDVHVFTTSVDGDSDSNVPYGQPVALDGVQVWYFPSRALRRLYYSPALYEELKANAGEFDIIHGHSVYLWPTWAARRIADIYGVPYMLSPRGMLVKELVRRKSRWIKMVWLQLIEKRNIESAAGVHVTSSTEAAALKEFNFKVSHLYTVPNSVPVPVTYDTPALSEDVKKVVEDGPYTLYFGRLNWEKGLDRLLRAWKSVPNHRLVIAGNDEEEYTSKLNKLVQQEGLSDQVVIISRSISGADKEALLQTSSLLVLPSYSENFGNVVLEAMIRAVPVVVTEEVGARDVVISADSGVVVNENSMSSSLNRILGKPGDLSAMGARGRDWVERNMMLDHVARKMELCYLDMLERA